MTATGPTTEGKLALAAEEPKLLSFDAWARVSAEATGLELDEREDLVRRRGVAAEDWAHSDKHWTTTLALDVARGDLSRIKEYSALCRREFERRERGEPSVAEAPPADARATEPLPDVAAPAPQVPTYLMPNVIAASAPVLDEVDVESTLEAVLEKGATLPFGARPTEAFEEWLAGPSVPPRPPAKGTPPEDPLEGTVMVPLEVAHAPALPFVSPAAPAMPIDRYASLCAALAVFPQRGREILARFGVADDAAKQALDQAWREAFARAPAELARWQELFTRFCAAMSGAADAAGQPR